MSVGLFRIRLLSHEGFSFRFPDYVHYNEDFVLIKVLFHTFYCNFIQVEEYLSFVILKTSL